MATKKLSELDTIGTITGSEYIFGIQNGMSRKIPLTMISSTTYGKNLLSNASFNNGTLDGWYISDPYSILGGSGVNLDPSWTLLYDNTAWFAQGTATSGFSEIQLWSGHPISVVGGNRYEFYAYTGAHRCGVRVICIFHDINGNQLSYAPEAYNNNEAGGGQYLSGYKQTGLIVYAPSNAVTATIIIAKNNTNAGESNSYAFVSHCYFGEATITQTDFSPWSDVVIASSTISSVSMVDNVLTDILKVTVNSTGSPINIAYGGQFFGLTLSSNTSVYWSESYDFYLYRDSTELVHCANVPDNVDGVYNDNPGIGTHTYIIKAKRSNHSSLYSSGGLKINNPYLVLWR